MNTSKYPFFEKQFKRLDVQIAHSGGDPYWLEEKAKLQKQFDDYVKNRNN